MSIPCPFLCACSTLRAVEKPSLFRSLSSSLCRLQSSLKVRREWKAPASVPISQRFILIRDGQLVQLHVNERECYNAVLERRGSAMMSWRRRLARPSWPSPARPWPTRTTDSKANFVATVTFLISSYRFLPRRESFVFVQWRSGIVSKADQSAGAGWTSEEKKAFEALSNALLQVQKDITLGRRIGLYRYKSDLGKGNFSKGKLATHLPTKGEESHPFAIIFPRLTLAVTFSITRGEKCSSAASPVLDRRINRERPPQSADTSIIHAASPPLRTIEGP